MTLCLWERIHRVITMESHCETMDTLRDRLSLLSGLLAAQSSCQSKKSMSSLLAQVAESDAYQEREPVDDHDDDDSGLGHRGRRKNEARVAAWH